MILKDELYSITSHEAADGTHTYRVLLNHGSFIYAAHFPGEPITPGVCLIDMCRELLEDALQLKLDIATVKNAKFLSVATPKETTELTCTLGKIAADDGTAEVKAQATLTANGEVKAKISLICTLT